jgi:hypothetical protein
MLPHTRSPEQVDLSLLQHKASDGLHGDAIATVLCYRLHCVLFFSWRNFAKFRPEKYDFDLYKGFLMKKWHKFRQISKKKISKLPDEKF